MDETIYYIVLSYIVVGYIALSTKFKKRNKLAVYLLVLIAPFTFMLLTMTMIIDAFEKGFKGGKNEKD